MSSNNKSDASFWGCSVHVVPIILKFNPSDHRTVFDFLLTFAPKKNSSVSGSCSHALFSLHDTALTYTCAWHSQVCCSNICKRFKAHELPEGTRITGAQDWFSALLLCTEIAPDSLKPLAMLCAVNDEIFIVFRILSWETLQLFCNCFCKLWTSLLRVTLPLLILNNVIDLLPISLIQLNVS